MEPMLATIIMFAGNFAPRNWAFCDGQLLSIASNTALFSLLGTTYGGDGRTTFGLPDLRGRVPMHRGNGPGLTPRSLGQKTGAENVTLNTANLASHTHDVNIGVTDEDGGTNEANGNILANTVNNNYSTGSTATGQKLSGASATSTGGGAAINIVQPVLGVNFIIALQGVFPSRS